MIDSVFSKTTDFNLWHLSQIRYINHGFHSIEKEICKFAFYL